MNKILLLIAAIITCITPGQAQDSVYPKMPFTNLYTLSVSGDNLFATGTCSQAQISIDGGETWEIFEIESQDYIFGNEIIPNTNGNEAYLIDRNELYSINTNQTFNTLNTQGISQYGNFKGMEVDNDYIYIISDGAINRAPHSTLEWELVTEVIYDTPYVISTTSSSPSYIYVGSREGHIFQTSKTAGGYTELANQGDFIQKIEMASDMVGYITVSGQSGPLKTNDGGNNWTTIFDWPENNPVHVYNEDIFLTSNTNRYFVSTDGGATVNSYYIWDDASAGLISNVTFDDDGTIYMVGESSTVLRSTDMGATYDNLIPLNRERLYNIDLTTTSGIAIGDNSIVVTEDGGDNWMPMFDGVLSQINDAKVIGQGKYAIATEEGVSIIENGDITSTAGASAYRIFSTDSYMLAAMQIGTSHVISKSLDNGLTWSNKIFNDDYMGRIKMNAAGTIYSPAGQDKYLKSDDDGETWEEVVLPVNGWFRDMVLDDNISLFTVGNGLYSSTDGTNFNQIATGYLIDNIYILEDDHITYTGGSNNQTYIYERKAGENNFSTVKQWCGTSLGSFNDNGVVWYAKAGGHINNYNFDLMTSTIDVNDIELNIYPNPITAGESIRINGIEQSSTVSVTNSLGITIISIPNVQSNIEIETNALSAGNYYISISNPTEIRSTKLMVF